MSNLLYSVTYILAIVDDLLASDVHARTAISAAKRDAAFHAMADRLLDEDARGSTGSAGKACDTLVRDLLYVRGVRKESDVRTRENFFADGRLRYHGKWYDFDVKTGGNFGPTDGATWTDDDLRIRRKHADGHATRTNGLLFFPIVNRIADLDDLLDYTAVFETQEFIDYLHDNERAIAPRAGYRGIFNVARDGARSTTMVTKFQPQPLARLRNLMADDIDHGDLTTLRDFILSK